MIAKRTTRFLGIVLLTVSGLVAQAGVAPVAHASFPGDNGLIAFTAVRGRAQVFQIYTMEPDGSNKTQLTDGPFEEFPAWSPDGTQIAFDGAVAGGGNAIWVMNWDGSGLTQLTSGADYDEHPSWSPDGSQIVFNNYSTGAAQIFTMNSDGTGITQITSGGFNYWPDWSPKGDKIAFASFARHAGVISSVNPDGSAMMTLTSGPADGDPGWAPDGSRIIFNGGHFNPTGRRFKGFVFTINAVGSGRRRLNGTRSSGYPEWSPDGFMFAYTHFGDRHSTIYVQNINGSSPVKLNLRSDALDASWQALED